MDLRFFGRLNYSFSIEHMTDEQLSSVVFKTKSGHSVTKVKRISQGNYVYLGLLENRETITYTKDLKYYSGENSALDIKEWK